MYLVCAHVWYMFMHVDEEREREKSRRWRSGTANASRLQTFAPVTKGDKVRGTFSLLTFQLKRGSARLPLPWGASHCGVCVCGSVWVCVCIMLTVPNGFGRCNNTKSFFSERLRESTDWNVYEPHGD